MKLSTRSYYAVMAMVDVAINGAGGPVSLSRIAERQSISLSYLEQLFGKLRRGGIVNSVRGPGGGYLLARSADQTRISDIFFAVSEPLHQTRCNPDSPKGCLRGGERCITHDLWEDLGRHIHLFLSAHSLEDVLMNRIDRSPTLVPEDAHPPLDAGGGMAAANPSLRLEGC